MFEIQSRGRGDQHQNFDLEWTPRRFGRMNRDSLGLILCVDTTRAHKMVDNGEQ